MSSASLAFSLSICEISFSSCRIRCLRAIDLTSIATTGCQLSLDNQRRQRGNEDKWYDLLIDPDGGASKAIDMVVTSEQRDQAKQEPANDSDPALKVNPKNTAASTMPLAHTRYGVCEEQKRANLARVQGTIPIPTAGEGRTESAPGSRGCWDWLG